ncbi:MAG: Bro-N domain-containing protein [Candidatus Nomurabacteria bacterium]|nr:Bro-N domain-containing protein [Candidatus Nomurabacteria bacterium]
MKSTTKIVLFKNKQVRKILHNNEWWFSIIDIIYALTDSLDPNDYWYKMKTRVKNEDGIELSTICRRLKLLSSDGKRYETDCVNTEDAFRIIQSIPSPKAEPFKRWLAKVGYERVQEIENPELATKNVPKLKADAKAGGDIAGGARKKLEKRLGHSIVTNYNFFKKTKNKKL